jgi:hypothetical protein
VLNMERDLKESQFANRVLIRKVEVDGCDWHHELNFTPLRESDHSDCWQT